MCISGSVGAVSHVHSVSQKPCMVSAHNVAYSTVTKSRIRGLAFGGSSLIKWQGLVVSCIKATETTAAVKSGGELVTL